MQVEVWRISGSSGFHFGRHGLGQEETLATMPSDSLFAALINRLAVSAGGNVDDFVKDFKKFEPPFVLSSTFPFAGGVLFFPVPFAALGSVAKEDDAKRYKRVRYVSQKLFDKLINGKGLKEIYEGAHRLMADTVLLDESEKYELPENLSSGRVSSIWSIETRPRVTLGRSAQNSSIFFTGRVIYASECGLWFGLYWRKQDDALMQQVANLFAELGYSGLGAERSVGFGGCEIRQHGTIDLPDAEGKPWVSLSRYLPRKEEIGSLKNGAYKLINVSGWLDSPVMRGQRRRPVNMLEEGATLGKVSSAVPGDIVDVSPHYNGINPLGHDVYRSGLALAVEWKGGLE
jgi:CRISPR-associated protein Csm4